MATDNDADWIFELAKQLTRPSFTHLEISEPTLPKELVEVYEQGNVKLFMFYS